MTGGLRPARAVNISNAKRLLLATNNQGKIKEFQSLLQGIPFELTAPADLGLHLEVEESGTTYQANARLKATAFSRASGLLTLADDSGLEVDALNGAPGILSSRYAGPGSKDVDRVTFLLDKLRGIAWEKRTARFRCVIAISTSQGEFHYFEGKCEGIIALEPKGNTGFGYDPIFYFPEYAQTMAELPEETKNQISHRARAAQAAVQFLSRA
jgi:XTP/dITP diphosphohydrolase